MSLRVVRATRLMWVALVVAGLGAHAATVQTPEFDALLHGAGFIAEGRVEALDPAAGWGETPRTRIALRVVEAFAGKAAGAGDAFDFVLPEGYLADGRFAEIVEAPRFVSGQHYLVFFTRRAWHLTPVVGWWNGLLRRVDGPDGPVWVDGRGRCVTGIDRRGISTGPTVAGPEGWAGVIARWPADDPPTATCLPADAFRAQLRERLAELKLGGTPDVPRAPASVDWPLSPAKSKGR